MLRLEAVLADRPDEGLPVLENDVRREEGPEASAPVGDTERAGDAEMYRPFRSRSGMSLYSIRIDEKWILHTYLLQSRLSPHCIEHMGSSVLLSS